MEQRLRHTFWVILDKSNCYDLIEKVIIVRVLDETKYHNINKTLIDEAVMMFNWITTSNPCP